MVDIAEQFLRSCKELQQDPAAVLQFGKRALKPTTTRVSGGVALGKVVGEAASAWIIPGLILGMLTVGMVRKVKIYEKFIEGAKEGFSLAVTIIPYLVAILAAVGMFRKSGGMDALVSTIGPATTAL